MTLATHEVPASLLRQLAAGSASQVAIQLLLAGQRSKNLLLIRVLADLAQSARHAEAAMARDAFELLQHIERLDREAVERTLLYPAVGAWAIETVLGLRNGQSSRARPWRLALVAAATAIRAGVPCEVEVASPGPRPTVSLPGLGRITLPGTWQERPIRLTVTTGMVTVSPAAAGHRATIRLPTDLREPSHGWQPLTAIAVTGPGGTPATPVFDDLDPYRFPGYPGLLEDLPTPERAMWLRRLGAACTILAKDHPEAAAEVSALVTNISPLASPDVGHVSATSRHALGSVALSLPEDDVHLALALAHEVQHVKLAGLMDLLPLISAPRQARFYAPWREDARPLDALLQGVYAHIEVAEFWRDHRHKLQESDKVHAAHVEFARWRDASLSGVDFLCGRRELTPAGQMFVAGMAERLTALQDTIVPGAAIDEARRQAHDHRERWLQRQEQVSE
jgi:HEXXH motif-containing protein